MEIDTPLDEAIKKTRQERRNNSKAARGKTASSASAKGRNASANVVRSAGNGSVTAVSRQPTQALPADSSKIVVSNLPQDVSEQQVKELFDSTIGPVKKVSIAFDSNGRSSGTATIEFRRPGDGSKASTQYNGRLIDNKRPMKVEIIVDPNRIPKPPLSTRVAPPARGAAPAAATSAGEGSKSTRGKATRGKGARGRGGKRGGGEARQALTAEELDAQMDAYVADGSAPAS